MVVRKRKQSLLLFPFAFDPPFAFLRRDTIMNQPEIVESRQRKLSLSQSLRLQFVELHPAHTDQPAVLLHDNTKFDTALFGIDAYRPGGDAVSDDGLFRQHTLERIGRRRPYFFGKHTDRHSSDFLPPFMQSSYDIVYLTIATFIFYTERTVFETPHLALAPG
jgi:hypothetical protein